MGNINWGRIGTGIMKGLGGLAVVIVGAAVVGATGGAALPAIMALLSGTMTGASLITLGTLGAGIGAMLFGTADIFEGSQDAILGVLGSNTAAYNPIRDELFGGNAELYYMTEALLSYGASAGLYVYQSYDLGGQLETAASMNYGRSGVVVQKLLNFRTDDLLNSHYNKHKAEFGNITRDEYLQKANDLISSSGEEILTKTRDNGDILYYNKITNEFAVKTKEGFLRTFFKPKAGLEYFNKQ